MGEKLHALARVIKYMYSNQAQMLMRSFTMSQFTYCPLIWMYHNRKINKQIKQVAWTHFPVDTGRKLNVHKTFRRRPGRLLNVLCKFNLRPVSTGFETCFCLKKISRYYSWTKYSTAINRNIQNKKQGYTKNNDRNFQIQRLFLWFEKA